MNDGQEAIAAYPPPQMLSGNEVKAHEYQRHTLTESYHNDKSYIEGEHNYPVAVFHFVASWGHDHQTRIQD